MGEPIPDDCFAPPIPDDGALAYEAFWRLCGGRPVTLRSKVNCDGLAPVAIIYPWPLAIPWMAISVYAERYGITEIDEFELFADLVRSCDEAYLAKVRDR